MYKIIYPFILLFAITSGCKSDNKQIDSTGKKETKSMIGKTIGKIERLDPMVNQLIPEDAVIKVLAEGFGWSEGALWIPEGNYVLFSDISPNTIYKWKEGEGLSVYLTPSGYTGDEPRPPEPGQGSNGLLLDAQNNLVICQHGDRRMARMDSPLDDPKPKFITLAGDYNSKKFSSPNDAAYHSNGDLYFTDPPYALAGLDDDPKKEIPVNGVYRTDKKGKSYLLTDKLNRPNGIAFSPDEKTLYVSNSDKNRPVIMAFDVKNDGSIENGRVFFDASHLFNEKATGVPDGMKVNKDGCVFATGPGGVLILTPDGKHIGTINTGVETANCAFSGDGYLYITANMYLARVKLQ